MCQLSIIIPADGSQEELDDTLVSVLESRPDDCEVIVCHAESYQDPYDLADEVRFVVSPRAGRAALWNAGIRASSAPFLHLLAPGVRAVAGWTEAPLARLLADPRLDSVSPALITDRSAKRLAGAGVRYGSNGRRILVGRGDRCRDAARYDVQGPTAQGAFFRKQSICDLGGCRDCFGDDNLDTDWTARMTAAGQTCAHVGESRLITPVTRTRRGFRAALHLEQLYRHHRQSGDSSVSHLFSIAGDSLRQLPSPSALTSLLGRLCGMRSPDAATLAFESFGEPATAHDDQGATISLSIESARQHNSTPAAEPRAWARSA